MTINLYLRLGLADLADPLMKLPSLIPDICKGQDQRAPICAPKGNKDLTAIAVSPCPVKSGERIRTSDLLNPINEIEAGSNRRISQVQAF